LPLLPSLLLALLWYVTVIDLGFQVIGLCLWFVSTINLGFKANCFVFMVVTWLFFIFGLVKTDYAYPNLNALNFIFTKNILHIY
jgi:hypothetical protein